MTFREKLDAVCEYGILAAVLGVLIWGPLSYGAVRVEHGSEEAPHWYGFLVLQCLTALALVLWGARCFTQRPFRLLWPPVCWGVLAFLLYAIARCQFVEVEYAGRQQLVSVVLYGALFFVILNNFNRKESATTVAVVLIALGLAESMWAFYQFASHNPRVWGVFKPEGYAGRGSGSYINPNSFAGMVEMILPLALAYTAMARVSATARVLLGYSALVMLAGVVVSESRGGNVAMMGTLGVFCVVLLCQRDYWKRGLVALGVLAVAGMFLFQEFEAVQRRLELAGGLLGHGDGRKMYWPVAEHFFHQHFLWGAGPGLFKYLYATYAPEWGQFRLENAHNDYLNTLCEWGFAGFGLIIATMGLLYGGVARMWPNVKRRSNENGKKNSTKAAFVLGASLGLLAILIHSEVDFNMQIPANACIAVALMALLAAQWRFATERYWFNPGKVGKILLAAVAFGTAGYLAVTGAQTGKEFYWIDRSMDKTISWDAEVAALTKAHEIDPRNYMTPYELGECYRLKAWEGDPGNEALATKAMSWFEEARILNPLDSWSPMRYGMCLDWLNRPKEASSYFVQALELRPNNAIIYFYLGRHCMDLENYPLAEHWFEVSQLLHPPSEEAEGYLKVVRRRMTEPKELPKL